MLKTLHLNTDITDGGASRCVRELFEQLQRYDVSVEVLVTRHPGKSPPGIRVVRQNWERWLGALEALPGSTDWRNRGSMNALANVQCSEFDLIHLHNIHSGGFCVRAVQDLCQRVPTVWTLHDEWGITGGYIYNFEPIISKSAILAVSSMAKRWLGYSPYHDNFRVRDMGRLLDRHLPQPQTLIAPSGYMAKLAEASGRFPRSEILVVRNGVRMFDVAESVLPQAEARLRMKVPDDAIVVLMMAPHLDLPHKGIFYGVQAINRLTRSDVHVLLVGGVANHVAARIRYPSTCFATNKDAELACAYRAADVTLLPSLGESFSLVGAESMACAVPVVCFNIGGLKELVGDNERGLKADPFHVDQLADHLATLLDSLDLRERLGAAGRQWIHDECRMEKYLTALRDVYRNAIASSDISRKNG